MTRQAWRLQGHKISRAATGLADFLSVAPQRVVQEVSSIAKSRLEGVSAGAWIKAWQHPAGPVWTKKFAVGSEGRLSKVAEEVLESDSSDDDSEEDLLSITMSAKSSSGQGAWKLRKLNDQFDRVTGISCIGAWILDAGLVRVASLGELKWKFGSGPIMPPLCRPESTTGRCRQCDGLVSGGLWGATWVAQPLIAWWPWENAAWCS